MKSFTLSFFLSIILTCAALAQPIPPAQSGIILQGLDSSSTVLFTRNAGLLKIKCGANFTTCSFSSGTWTLNPAAASGGTVTSFSAGTLSPLFTTSVANSTTTPALSFSLSSAAARTLFGNNTTSSAAPAFFAPLTARGDLLLLSSGLVFDRLALGAADTVLMGSATDPSYVAVNNCGDSTHAISYSTSTHTWGCQAISAGSGTVTNVSVVEETNIGATVATATSTPVITFRWVGTLANARLANSSITLNAGTNVGLTAPGAMSLGSTYTFGATSDTPRFAGLGLGGAAGAAGLKMYGATSGSTTFLPADAAGTTTIKFPGGTIDFSATGGTSQVVQQTSAGGAFTVARLNCASLSDASTTCATAGVPTTRAVNTTSPITGGGDLSADRTIACATCTTASSPTNHGVILGAGTQALGVTAVGATNTVLHGNTGADPTYSAVTASDFGTQTANTYLAGPTSGSAATPTFRAMVVGDIPSGAAGMCWQFAYLPNCKMVNVQAQTSATGDADLGTVPAGKRWMIGGATLFNASAGNIVYYIETKPSGGVYHRLTNTSGTIATGATSNLVSVNGYIAEAGDTISINTTTTAGMNVFIFVLEFDNTAALRTYTLVSFISGNNTLYTVPANKTACPVWVSTSTAFGFGGQGAAIYSNDSGSTRNRYWHIVKSGNAVGTTYQVTPTTATVSNLSIASSALSGCMAAGDFINLNVDSNSSSQFAWVTVVEL